MSAEPQAGIEEEIEEEAQEENEEEAEGQAEEGDEDEEEEKESWQDDHSSTITAQERTGTKLCNACARIFRPNRKRNEAFFYRHIECLDTLERSASHGCELCNHVLRRLKSCELEYAPSPELYMGYYLTEYAASLDPPKPETLQITFLYNCYSRLEALQKSDITAFLVGKSFFESLLSCSIC